MTTPPSGTGVLNNTPNSPTGPATGTTSLNNHRQNASFPTLNPPAMQTLVYAPDVTILIEHEGEVIDVSQDIVRGQVVRKENSASSLFVTLNNVQLKYTAPARFSRMDRIACYLTRTQQQQVFSGYLDTIPWIQAYPGTVDIRATCTLKRLLHAWWNPYLPNSQQFFDNLGPSYGTAGDQQGPGGVGGSLGGILYQLLVNVGNWAPNTIQIQDFPQQFIAFLNEYFIESNMAAHNASMATQFNALILGDDESPGPMGAVGYLPSDPVGTAASATNSTIEFFLGEIVKATDGLGMGPIVDSTANSQQLTDTADILETAQGAGGLGDQALAKIVAQGGQDLGQESSNWNTQNQNSDAAILALAAAAVETGGGSPEAIQMEANNSDPSTLTFFYSSLCTTGTGSGLYLMPNNGTWGTPAQRMNPYSSTNMFLNALNGITGWRNMDGGQAIFQVLQTDSSLIPQFDAAIKEAAPIVQAYRQAQQGASNAANSALSNVPGAGALSGLLGGGANTIGGAVGTATTSPLSAGASALQTGRPVPDSEGAINCAYTLAQVPYLETSEGMDCSHLVQLSFQSIGFSMPRNTAGQLTSGQPVYPFTSALRGDVLQTDGGGHTGIYLGNGTMIQTGGPTGTTGGPQAVSFTGGPNGVSSVRRMCANGGQDPGAPFSPPTSLGNGLYAVGGQGGGIPPGTGTGGPQGGGGGSSNQNEPIARNLFSYMFYPGAYAADAADLLTGEKAYVDGQPLMQMVRALSQASLRNFQSAPNGNFIAYYPDEFGLYGKSPVLNLVDLELKDCHIDLSDDNLTTHVYVEGDYTMMGQADATTGWIYTSGVATVENPQLYQNLAQAAPGDVDQNLTAQQLMNRFGVRPYKDSYQLAGNAGLEFFLAATIFMGKWASQYTTDIGLTFMPELYPGMRINIDGHGLQVYCSQVTHVFDWERGFVTNATVNAASSPSRIQTLLSRLGSLGGLNPISTNTLAGGNTTSNGAPAAPNTIAGAPAGSPLAGGIFGTVFNPALPNQSPFGQGGGG
jgi:cell wall-associated NlpC family hydrolase